MLLLDCAVSAVNQTEQIILQVLKMKTITFLQRKKMMRITTLLSWKGDPNSNWRSSQTAHLPTLTYPPKQACSCRGAGLPVSSLPSRRFLKLKITLQVNRGKKYFRRPMIKVPPEFRTTPKCYQLFLGPLSTVYLSTVILLTGKQTPWLSHNLPWQRK